MKNSSLQDKTQLEWLLPGPVDLFPLRQSHGQTHTYTLTHTHTQSGGERENTRRNQKNKNKAEVEGRTECRLVAMSGRQLRHLLEMEESLFDLIVYTVVQTVIQILTHHYPRFYSADTPDNYKLEFGAERLDVGVEMQDVGA